MSNSNLRIQFNAPLDEKDTELQTYGCRANNPDICANNPDICANNSIPGICAFTSEDRTCKKPSRAWKKKYFELKGSIKNE